MEFLHNRNNHLNRGPEFKRKKSRNKEKQRKSLVTSGTQFIQIFQKLLQITKPSKEDRIYYMQRVLHAIFFFGHINKPQIRPELFIPDRDVAAYKKRFQQLFQEYKTHFPRQTPYSILLEYVTKMNNTENKESLKETLVELNTKYRESIKKIVVELNTKNKESFKQKLVEMNTNNRDSVMQKLVELNKENVKSLEPQLVEPDDQKAESLEQKLMELNNENTKSLNQKLVELSSRSKKALEQKLMTLNTKNAESLLLKLVELNNENMETFMQKVVELNNENTESLKQKLAELSELNTKNTKSLRQKLVKLNTKSMQSLMQKMEILKIEEQESLMQKLEELNCENLEPLMHKLVKLNIKNPNSLMAVFLELNKLMWRLEKENSNKLIVNDFAFSASVVAHSYIKDPNNANFLESAYGASLSCTGKKQRGIMICLSALFVWDKAISYAVSCENSGHGIVFPQNVHCVAYKFNNHSRRYKKIPPCVKCNKMFKASFDPKHRVTDEPQEWPYGNCAETESFSKLLHGSEEVRNNVRTFGDNRQHMSREDIERTFDARHEGRLQEKLGIYLEQRNFHVARCDWKIYTPASLN
ncbi:interaptin-like [Hyperolius riggenbachi]|uniref:interaptin-like n=1 Tax=Hyperolius riggenbachi TaxID=752182 RepID=UPI0035A2B9F6